MSELHHSHHWQRVARQVITANPLCADPFGYHALVGSFAPAQCVHHIEPVEERPDLLYHADNLLPLCNLCHAAIPASRDALSTIMDAGVDSHVVARVVASKGKPQNSPEK